MKCFVFPPFEDSEWKIAFEYKNSQSFLIHRSPSHTTSAHRNFQFQFFVSVSQETISCRHVWDRRNVTSSKESARRITPTCRMMRMSISLTASEWVEYECSFAVGEKMWKSQKIFSCLHFQFWSLPTSEIFHFHRRIFLICTRCS